MSNTTHETAMNRINALLDEGSFVEVGSYVTARNTDFNLQDQETPADGVVTGYGTMDGVLVYVYSQDASVLGGAIGEMHAKKIAAMYKMAMKMGAPVIGLVDCAGLRLQEACDALDAFGCHGIGGIWGGIATGLFARTSINSVAKWDGLVFGDIHLFAAQILSIVITAAVAVVGTLICIGIIRIFTPLRVDQKEEMLGLDVSQHGENAYPSFNGFD